MKPLQSRLPFLALPLLLAPFALAAACNSSVETGAGGGTGASTAASTGTGSAACPTDPPQDGTACDGPSGDCHYPVPCCADTVATCTSGHWSVQGGTCIEKTPDPCPPDQPNTGDPCTPSCLPVQCTYGDCGDGTPAAFASCNGSTWDVSQNCAFDAGTDAGLPENSVCGQDADGGVCAPGLACCYPCGIPGCMFKCTKPCDPADPGCSGGCELIP